jgi:hypothetical protein
MPGITGIYMFRFLNTLFFRCPVVLALCGVRRGLVKPGI